jgi:hypothetical protein
VKNSIDSLVNQHHCIEETEGEKSCQLWINHWKDFIGPIGGRGSENSDHWQNCERLSWDKMFALEEEMDV